MHRECSEAASKRMMEYIELKIRNTVERPIDISIGDLLLRGFQPKVQGPIIALKWIGPYRVSDARDSFVF